MRPLAEILGESPGIVAICEQVERLLKHQPDGRRLPPILLQGETGTGKGMLAHALHRAGPRRDGPFVDVNCAAIPESLLEAEMFGYERGAFTDARQAKPGLFRVAHRGTIFLDEVGLMPEVLQGKLLKVIEERSVRRLGGIHTEPVDVWIITANNGDLLATARERRFREDLYHRLAVLTLWLPALRERGRDVVLLAEHFLRRACADYELPAKELDPSAHAALLGYPWPGNVRELANVMERVALLSEAPLVTKEMLGLPEPAPARLQEARRPEEARPQREPDGTERERLLAALRKSDWNLSRAAARLGLARNTLRYRMEKYGLDRATETALVAEPPRTETPVSVRPPAPTRGAGSVRWEARRLTFLHAVLVDPATGESRRASRGLEVIAEKTEAFGGRVEDRGPSELTAAFGLDAIEDAPRRAAHAAMAMLKATERARDAGAEARVKLAIHVAQVLVGHGGATPEVDPQAKRETWAVLEELLAYSEDDTIVVTDTAAPFLERHFALIPVAADDSVRGRVWRLGGGEPGVARRLATFVGRVQELELLKSRLDIAMRGHGQVVGILGVPGIGKTRLLAEFRRALQGVEVTYLEGQCRSYGSTTPYLPVLDILRYNFRITEADTPEVIVEKVRGALQELAMDPGEWAPYLLHLLDVRRVAESLANVSPGAVKARTFEALRLMCLNGSRRRPIVFVIEDLHWVDATTEECLLSLMESAAHARAMFIGTYRPGYRTPWVDRSYASQIALQPLSDGDSLSIVRSLLPRGEISEDIARLILDKAEGNPYFLEELSREVGEAGGSRVRAPETVQEVILGRLDRLSEGAKRLLQTASVLGREVPLALLKELWAPASGLDAHLHELAKSELLSAHGGVEQRYAFAHTLTQEVVYESLSLPRRQALHAAAARALEQIHTNRREEVYDRLGYHYSRAGQSAQAVEYLTRMAEKAAFANAHSEAVGVLDEALSHVDRFPEAERGRQRLELVLRQAASLVYLGRFQDIVDLLLRHEGDLQASQDTQLIGQYHFLIARSYLFLGDDARAAQHAERAIAEATRSGDESTLGKVHYVLAQHGALTGRFEEGLQHGQQAAALLERAGQGWWIGPAHWAVGLNLALRGEFEAALEAEARATSIATVVGDPQLLSSASWATGVIQTAMGEWEAGVAACQRALDRSPDPLDTALALGWLGFAHVERGEPVQAIPLLEQAVRELAQFKFPQPQGWFTVFLAEAHRLAGRLETAIGLAAQGLRIARESGSPYGVGLARRALGRATQTKGALTEAESHLQGARETFASTSAQYDAARTHLDLAALAYARADRIAVAGHLRQARDLFTVMRAARYVARADELAAQFGVSLT